MPWALVVWAVIVIVSMLVVVVLAQRWGRDPFGFALLAAVLGPIAIVALVGSRQSDRQRTSTFEGARSEPATGGAGRVLIPVDGSDSSTRAAAAVANLGINATEAIVLTVLAHERQPGPQATAAQRQEHQREVDRLTRAAAKSLADAGIPSRVLVGYGVPAEEIIEAARAEGATAVVIGRRGAGLTKALLGSVSDDVVKNATVPVVVVD